MVKRLSALLVSLFISLTPLLIFAPTAHAASITWDGGGSDSNFSTPENWVGDVAPVDGDSLVFPAASILQTPYNDTTLTYNGISFSGTPSGCIGSNGYTFTGSQDLNVNGDIINDLDDASTCNVVNFNLNVNITGNLTINAASEVTFGPDSTTTLSLGTADINMQGEVIVRSVLTGGGTSSITVTTDGAFVLETADPGFNGDLILNGAYYTFGGGFGSATGSTTVNSGASICYNNGGVDTTLAEPFTFNIGTFNTDYAVFNSFNDCGRGGAESHSNELTTLSGPITIAQDVVLDTLGTIAITGTVTGSFNFKVPYGSYGVVQVAGSNVTTQAHEVTVANGDNSSDFVRVGNLETYIINGTRGDVNVNSGGTLKGSGTVGDVTIYDGAHLAPGNSPGCLNTGNLTFQSGSTYEFEVGGTTECTEYDQTKVTGTVDLGNGTLSLVRYNDFKPVKDQSYTIILNDGTSDAVTGTFNNLAEGATFTVDGYVFQISYTGGDGNDVVVTVQSVPATPNTGFELLSSHPFVTLLTTSLLAAAIALIARRYSKLGAN